MQKWLIQSLIKIVVLFFFLLSMKWNILKLYISLDIKSKISYLNSICQPTYITNQLIKKKPKIGSQHNTPLYEHRWMVIINKNSVKSHHLILQKPWIGVHDSKSTIVTAVENLSNGS